MTSGCALLSLAACLDEPQVEPDRSEIVACDQSGAPIVDTGPYPAQLVDWVQNSSVVFRGVVTQVQASSFDYPGFDLSKTIVVAPIENFGANSLPSEVSVQVDSISEFEVGSDAVFFARPWVAGEGVGVVENAYLNVADYPQLPAAVATVKAFVAQREIHTRLTQAELVMSATVDSVGHSTSSLDSEHNPLWAQADLVIDDVICGSNPGNTASMRFASSVDVLWSDAPKLVRGEQRVFIAATDSVSGIEGPGFVVLDPADVQSTSTRSAYAELLAVPPSLDLRP
tara:strand:- start:87530 stop:88381 length:852 start_codon:yes stop_codon:yes gene_type:complete